MEKAKERIFEALVVPKDRIEKSCSRLLYMGKNQSTYIVHYYMTSEH